MELYQKLSILEKCNKNLRLLFPGKHIDITLEEIEKVYSRNVLSLEADAKTKKGSKDGYLTGIQYFIPANLSGVELCVGRSEGCTEVCLVFAGRGKFYWTTRQRAIKTLAYLLDKPRYNVTLKKSIQKLIKRAEKLNMVPVVRLNGTSDLLWDLNTDIIQSFPGVQFYDYTKIVRRLDFKRPENYHLTFSLSENNDLDALKALSKGVSVAVVFSGELPKEYMGVPVINGDETDLRFLDPQGVVVGLKAKGKAKKDTSGFVKRVEPVCGKKVA